MKLGAVNILEKPVRAMSLVACVDGLVGGGRSAISGAQAYAGSSARDAHGGRHGSVVDRWASLVVMGARAAEDLRTLALWARYVGVSYSSLAELCRLVGVRPHDARDFVRILRALQLSDGRRGSVEMMLDIADRRTAQRLLSRAGVGETLPSIELFLLSQTFIPVDTPTWHAVRVRIQEDHGGLNRPGKVGGLSV
jgi:hypothetical protein